MVNIHEGTSLSLHQLLEHNHQLDAIVMGRNTLRYGDFAVHLAMTLEELQNLKISRGKRIGFYLPNSFEYLNLILASWIAKLQTVLIPINFTSNQVQQIIKDYELDYLIVERPLCPEYPGIPVTQFSKAFRKRERAYLQNKVNFCWEIPFDQEVSIIFSSGTTGRPKGIIHSLGNFVYSALGTLQHYQITSNDSWPLTLSLYHVGGLLIAIRMILAGGKIIIPTKDQTISGVLLVHKPTFLSVVPTQLIRLLDKESNIERLKRVRGVLVGGGPTPSWPIQLAQEHHIPLSVTYGLTEMTSQVTARLPFSGATDLNSSGPPLPFRQIKIDEEGQIWVKGGPLFKAYTHGTDRITPFDDEGWFATQDIGHFDAEGHLHVQGRKDLVFISGGENVRPDLIEETIRKIPWVTEAIVVPVPHSEFGQVPIAYIEMVRKVPLKKIILFLREHLPAYMIPKKIIFLDDNVNLKHLKYDRTILAEKATHFGLIGPLESRA